jgi:hypothetical protein
LIDDAVKTRRCNVARVTQYESKKEEESRFQPGDLFRNPDCEGDCVYYILCAAPLSSDGKKQFVAYSLSDGDRWCDHTASVETAVLDLEPLPRGAQLTLEQSG